MVKSILINTLKSFQENVKILTILENYMIRDEKYKSLDFLNDMLKKNQKQRISLNDAKQRILSFLEISHLQ